MYIGHVHILLHTEIQLDSYRYRYPIAIISAAHFAEFFAILDIPFCSFLLSAYSLLKILLPKILSQKKLDLGVYDYVCYH